MKNETLDRYAAYLAEESNAAYLYDRLSEAEENADLAEVYRRLAATERRHAALWEAKIAEAGGNVARFRPSLQTRVSAWMARKFGAQSVAPALARTERKAASAYDGVGAAEDAGLPSEERSHARVFSLLAGVSKGMAGGEVARFEGRHRAGGNALRAGTLGANDGLLSVYSLVMGVAGAGVGQRQILVTGAAGLLAGALSMALGEWISVQSSRELYERQIDIERQELAENPEEEMQELALIYRAKGLDEERAKETARRIIDGGSESALDTLVREELAIDQKELGGSAWIAALTSFGLFAVGALFPTIPYLFFQGAAGIAASSVVSAAGLFAIGALATLMTGKNPLTQGLRQVLIGLAAAACTFGLGHLIGAGIAG
ncbi:MAG TPA: VIT1/CCC1 transporter family protein [Rectinemataceae bacterium]|nr:VIT1/CCC1 transporter family protein [Rectinemataceae bacterium]